MSRTVKFIIPRAFAKDAKKVFDDKHLEAIKAKLAINPELGAIIQNTGGARKVWQFGKSGQSRVIYYYHLGNGLIFLLACYPKSRKKDLSEAEKKDLRETIAEIKAAS